MNINGAFPSKFLKAADLKGAAVNVVISDVKVEQVGQDRDTKPVVYFQGKEKGLVLNKTNSGKISTIAGSPETEDWVGVTVQIFPTTTEFGGEEVECIRVRPPKTAKPVAPPPEAVTDDSISF